MSVFDPPEEQIVANTLEALDKFTRIIQELVAANRLLQESLDISTKELKKLKERAKQATDRVVV